VRVGKWRPPRHVPQVRPVSFEAASSKTGSPRVARVPAVAVPAKSLVVTETPRELSESQTRGAVPLTGKDSGSVPNPSVATDNASVQPASATTTVPAVITAGWSQRGEKRPE
jgi:hypothetical protein